MDVKSTTQLSTLPEFFAPDKLAAVFPVSRSTMYRALRRGEIPSLRVGKRFVLSRSHLEQWVEENLCKKEACALPWTSTGTPLSRRNGREWS